jgi:hypothetical protein
MWRTHLRPHPHPIERTDPREGDMYGHHHLIASELADLRRRDLLDDASKHRRIRRDGTRRVLRRR